MNGRGWSITLGVAVVVACGGRASRPSSERGGGGVSSGDAAGASGGVAGSSAEDAGATMSDAGSSGGAAAHGGALLGGGAGMGGTDAGAEGEPQGDGGEPAVADAGGAAGQGGAAPCDPLEGSCSDGPDGCAGLARGVRLTRIVAYQSVEIPLMNAGEEAPVGARTADMVSGRETLFRLFFDLERGFEPRELAARVFIENEGVVDVYSQRMLARDDSQDYYFDSTFRVQLPKTAIQPGTRYAAEIVECGGESGGLSGPRFPTSGTLELGARPALPLKVQIVPMRANGLLPDTSASALAVYEAALLAMYPISSVELGVGSPLEVADAEDWSAMLDRLRARRRSDAPPQDVYYYGMLTPAPTMSEYCQDDCTLGLGFEVPEGSARRQAPLRAALGVAYGDLDSIETMLHELGHNHGRSHAPCDVDDRASLDRSFPFEDGRTGVRGWDARRPASLIDTYTGDIMGYCSPAWIGEYSYQGLLTRISAVNGALALETADDGALGPWRVLLVDRAGARWGIPIPTRTPASGKAEPALVYDRLGRVIEVVDVHRSTVADGGASLEVPEPRPGWFRVEVAGAPAIAFDP